MSMATRRFLGGVQVGLDIEDGVVVIDEAVVGLERIDQLDKLCVRGAQVLVEELVHGRGALPDRQDQVVAALGDAAAEAPFLLVGTLVDQHVIALGRAHLVVVELLVVVDVFELVALDGFVVATVVEAFVLLVPACPGELAPFDLVGEVLAGVDVTHIPGAPVRAAYVGGPGHLLAVAADAQAAQGDRTVVAECVGVDQDTRLAVETFLYVDHRLVLQAVVLGEEVALALAERGAVLGVVPQGGQAVLDLVADGDALEVLEGDGVLGFDPGLGLVAVHVFEPAVGIGHLRAVVVVDLVDLVGRGILEGHGLPFRDGLATAGQQAHGGADEQQRSHHDDYLFGSGGKAGCNSTRTQSGGWGCLAADFMA